MRPGISRHVVFATVVICKCMKTFFLFPLQVVLNSPCGLKPIVPIMCNMVSGLNCFACLMHSTSHSLVLVGLGTSAVQKLQFPSLATRCCAHQITVLLLRRDMFSIGILFFFFFA